MKKRYWIAILCAILTLVLTVAAASADAGDVYGLTTDASDLHNGDRIILVSDDGSYYQAMATDFSGMQVIVEDNTITEQDGMLALTLTETDGGWLLASNDGYLAVDGDALTIVPDSANAAVWSISIATDGTATVSCTGGAIVFDEQDGAYRFFCGEGGNEIAIYNATFEAGQHPFGDGLWWSFANGKLTIGGSGRMPGFGTSSQPWNHLMNNITEVEIQNGVVYVSNNAFYGCSGLHSITLPCDIGYQTNAFLNCTGIKTVHLSKGKGIMLAGLANYYYITPWGRSRENFITVTLEDGIKNIGEYAFYKCEGLQSITIPDSVTSIGKYAFYECVGLQSVTIPDSVTSIGEYAFYSTGLQSVTIGNSVKTIGDSSFERCDELQSVTIPDSVNAIGDRLFYYCTGLQSVTLGDGVTSIGEYAFFVCEGISEITIPDSVTSIGNSAFSNCTGLTEITIGNGVESIGDSAFSSCTGLTSVTIPSSVTSIGNYAFYNCNSLTDVYFLGTKAQKEQIAFDSGNENLLNATWHYIEPEFKTQSLVLADSIGVNFFLQLPEIDGIDWSESYMTFTIFGIDGCTERCDYDPDFMNPGHTYYGFTCYVNAAQLADTITATFHYGPGLKVEKTYSVKEYLGTYDEYKSSFDPKTQAMIEALADYGHYVQAFLAAQKNWTYGVEHEEMDKYYTESYDIDTIKAAAADYAIVRVNESNGDVEKITYSMAVDSATAILVYFKPAADYTGTLTVKVNGEDYTATAVNGRYEVRIPDISAHQLGRTFTIVATTEHGTATAEVSALSYVVGSLNAYASVPLTANAMASIYRYAMAAEEYKN